MNDKIFSTTDARGSITEYKQLSNGTWVVRTNFEEWYKINGQPPAYIFNQSQKKVIPLTRKPKGVGLSGYDKFFIGNAAWYGNKLFASLPPSGPWILQFVLSQIIRDTSLSHHFSNAVMLQILSQKHYLWANISISNIVKNTGSSRNAVLRALNSAEQRGCILTVPGMRKNIDNKVYVCGVKNYRDYTRNGDKREWLWVDSPYAAEEGAIPESILAPLVSGLKDHKVPIDGLELKEKLFS